MNKAIIWIASGKKYINEAIISAKSAMKHNPDITRILCTPSSNEIDKPFVDDPFSSIMLLPERQHDLWFLDCTSYLLDVIGKIPADKVLLLDTDTYVCDDLSDYFTILDRFDIVGTHAPGRETAPSIYNVPASFPELHIGGLAFNQNITIRRVFESWFKLFKEKQDIYKENDQAPLRDTLWFGDVDIYAMPPEFCFRFPFGGLVRGKVKVLHGRSRMPYKQIEEMVNREWRKIRVFPRGHFR